MAQKQKTEVTDGSVLDPEASKSTANLDRERRWAEVDAAEKEAEAPAAVYAPYAVEGNDTSAYVGVSPEYMTYASETDRPFRAEEGTAERRDEDAALAIADGGSSVPLVYPTVSGEDFVTPEKAKDEPVDDKGAAAASADADKF